MTVKIKPFVFNVGSSGRSIIMTPTADGNMDLTLRAKNRQLYRIGRVIDPNEEVPALELTGPAPLASIAAIMDAISTQRKSR